MRRSAVGATRQVQRWVTRHWQDTATPFVTVRPPTPPTLRAAMPSDYGPIVAHMDAWWGRPVARTLPRLFLDHFANSSLVAECDGALVGFLIGFLSPTVWDDAYIHFAGVAPAYRRNGLARQMYQRFFIAARAGGCGTVRAITAPVNSGSIAFHRALGFTVTGPVHDYDGPGVHRVVFTRPLP